MLECLQEKSTKVCLILWMIGPFALNKTKNIELMRYPFRIEYSEMTALKYLYRVLNSWDDNIANICKSNPPEISGTIKG